MKNKMIVMIMVLSTAAAFGLLAANSANAGQLTTSTVFTLFSTSAPSPFSMMLVKDGQGRGHGGGHHGFRGGHHGGFYGGGGLGWGYGGGYWPYYYGSDSYSDSCYTCYWDGYKNVCYNSCDEF